MAHWSFSGLGLDDEEREQRFFKPTPGCACVFTSLSVRVTAEITPLGVTDYSPSTWSAVRSLLPQEFHRKCVEERVKLVDVRNHYESRIGYFVDGGGEEAVKPQVRRFSQWPQWVKEHCQELVSEDENESQQLLTYCTGGIRCEKGVRWMEEYLSTSEGHSTSQRPIYTLQGGIAAYLTWMEEEIATGRKTKEESLFKGQNYVFDARGSIGISDSEPVSECHVCKIKSARFGKCASEGCHLVLVVCEECEKGDVRCCSSCKENEELRKKAICECEQEREKQLWGGERVKEERTQGWRKKKRTLATATLQNEFTKGLDIRLKLAG